MHIQIPPPTITNSDTAPPQVLVSEITSALSQMANDRAPGKDGITAKMIKAAGYPPMEGTGGEVHEISGNGTSP